jgi:hypothetical protein
VVVAKLMEVFRARSGVIVVVRWGAVDWNRGKRDCSRRIKYVTIVPTRPNTTNDEAYCFEFISEVGSTRVNL